MDKFSSTRREVFFSNLLFLGLNEAALVKKYGIPINKDMFIVPNKKGYEIITHFLFSKLSATTGKDYNLPWPLLSIEQDRLFQKTCYSHLCSFSQENEVKFPRMVPLLLSLFGGERFYKLYLAFSSYVLKKVTQKNAKINLSRPTVNQENFKTVKNIVQLSTISKKENFLKILIASHQNDLIWKKYAENLSACLEKLEHILKSNKELIRSKECIVSRLGFMIPGESLKVEKLVEKSVLHWKPIRRQRKELEQFFSTEEDLWQCLASEVDENTENSILSPKDISAQITILEKLCSESEKVGISCSEESGKVPVTKFLNLLVACLKPITEIFKSNMCSIPETSFLNDGYTLKHDLSSIQNMIDKLSEDIPRLEDSIKELKLAHSFEHFEETSEISEICSLPNLSYNPEAVKARVSLIDPELEEKLHINISKEIANNSIFSAHLSVSQSLSEADLSATNLTSFHGLQLSEIVDFDGAPDVPRRVALVNSFRQKLVNESNKRTDALSLKQNEVPVESRPLKNNVELSDLDDLDFAPSTQFKMRDSWLKEESLFAETLPDMSFEE